MNSGAPIPTPLKFRKVARDLAYRRRGEQALNGNEQVFLKKLKRMIVMGLIRRDQLHVQNDPKELERVETFLRICMLKYYKTKVDRFEPLQPHPSRKRTIDSFDLDVCDSFFRFTRLELHRVLANLRMPEKMCFQNGASMSGEEVMLRGLYELVSGERQFTISVNVFGGGQPLQSRACTSFIQHVYDTHKHLLRGNVKWFHDNGLLDESAEAIGRKMMECDGFNPPPDWVNNVCMFIDCNCLSTSCPGGGPTEGGANAVRWSGKVQESFYNGWKSVHGLKHQSGDIAHGITVDLSEPHSLRRNDLYLLRQSGLNEQMRVLCLLYIFGDSAYKVQSNLTSYISEATLKGPFSKWNMAMKSVRIAIEWNYGYSASLFKYIADTDKLHILGSVATSQVYTVVTLLRNMRVFMKGGQSSVYFGIRMRDELLEHYMNQTKVPRHF
jgi:hypothetical protein